MDNELALPAQQGYIEAAPPAIPYNDIERMARAIAASRLFGIQTPEQAIALMLLAQAEGLHPATAARDYNIIQGRPSLKADAMLGRFQAAGGVVQWEEMTDTRVAAYFSHPFACPKPVLIDWDMQRAKQAQLGGKDMWSKYPRQMLRSRVISEGIRATYPGVLSGCYTPEEVQDFTPAPPSDPEPQLQVRKLPASAPPQYSDDVPPPQPAKPLPPPAARMPAGLQTVYIKAVSTKNAQRESKPFVSVKFASDEGDVWANVFDTVAWPLLVKGATVYAIPHKKGEYWNLDGISATGDGAASAEPDFASLEDFGPPLDMDDPRDLPNLSAGD